MTFEELVVGETRVFGEHTFSAAEIKRFAAAYDPQPFHVDDAAAAASHFGGLCASGWHTAAAMTARIVRSLRADAERAVAGGQQPTVFGPSPGFDNLKWLKPVYAGDTIAFSGRVVAKRLSESRPGWGIVSTQTVGTNQDGERVFEVTTHVFMAVGQR